MSNKKRSSLITYKNQVINWSLNRGFLLTAGFSLLIGFMVAFGVYTFTVSGWRADNAERETKVIALERENVHNRQLKLLMSPFLEEFKKMLADFHDAEPMLPSEAELAQVLDQVQESARRNQVVLTGLNGVKQSVPSNGSKTINEREFPSQVSGNFTNIVSFFNDVARMPRILVVRDFSISALKDGKTNAAFTLIAFHATSGVLPEIPAEVLEARKTPLANGDENAKY